MTGLPTGTVTFLFTDIEGSTRLLKQLGERYSEVLADHRRLLRTAFGAHGGHEIDTQGDSVFFAFPRAKEAVAAALEAQGALAEHPWPDGIELRVRMGLHSGEPVLGEERYVGLGVHRAARVGAAAHGGQVLLSSATRELVEDDLPEGVSLRDLGLVRLKDIDRPERISQLAAEGLRAEFPPLRGAERVAPPRLLRRRSLVLAMLAGVVAAAVAIPVSAFGGGGSGGSAALARVEANAVGVIDAKTYRILAQLAVGRAPTRLASRGRSVWVGADGPGTVSSLDPRTYAVTNLVAIGGFPSDLAVGEGAVWVVDAKRGLLVKVDPAYSTVLSRIRFSAPNPIYDISRESPDSTSIAAGSGSVWLTDGSRQLIRVDPKREVVKRVDLGQLLDGVAVGAGGVWAISGASATVFRLDSEGRVRARVVVVAQPGFKSPYPLAIAVGEGFVWVLNGNTATVTKIDPEQRTVSATIPIGIDRSPARLAVGAGAAWVANGDGTLSRIDPNSNALTNIRVGHSLKDVDVADGAVWVTAGSGLSGSPGTSPSAHGKGVRALPTSSCSPIYFGGGGHPQYLIASDLPLQGSGSATPQMSQAIQFVLRGHRFRAGRYAVGYQSCDDSTVPGGFWSPARCAANARAYASDPDVLGVIGALNSGCTQVEVPIANRAPRAPLGMIGFSTYVGLTHSGPGTAQDEPKRYYPTGKRNFVRIIAADDVQGAASAILARQLGARRVYVLNGGYPGETYGPGIAAAFESAAVRLGLTVVGSAEWNPASARGYRRLAARVRRARPDAVFLGGSLTIGALITDLRAALGPGVALMAPDGFAGYGFPYLVQIAGAAAEGLTVSMPGLPQERLPESGRDFVRAFGEAVGEPPILYSVYAAQAAEVLLQAIAASDGTRASVRSSLFKTKVSNSILGSFSIDRNGDTTAGAVTIYRIVGGIARISRVITPPPSLVR